GPSSSSSSESDSKNVGSSGKTKSKKRKKSSSSTSSSSLSSSKSSSESEYDVQSFKKKKKLSPPPEKVGSSSSTSSSDSDDGKSSIKKKRSKSSSSSSDESFLKIPKSPKSPITASRHRSSAVFKQTSVVEIREYVERIELEEGPGEIGFPSDKFEFVSSVDQEAKVRVVRTNGNTGQVTVDWFTRENTAVVDVDFVESDGWIRFEPG
uniref:Uncharacterized protein n=1 Tax=Ciona intestinalis TaxID=7719 RepID=F6TW28_CIOIN